MKKFFVLLSLVGIVFSGCTPVKIVSTDRLNSLQKGEGTTYKFAKLSSTVEVKRPNSGQIKAFLTDAIVREMDRRDYRLADSTEQADILIDLQLNIRDLDGRNDENRYNRYSGGRYGRYNSPYGYSRYGYPYGPSNDQLDTRSSMQATVTILIAKALPEQRLWRGVAMAQLAQKSEKSAMRLNMAIEQLMTEFEN